MSLKPILHTTLLAINILAVIALGLSVLGSVVSPVDFVWTIYFSLGLPAIFIANVLFVIIWASMRRWLFLISLVAMVLSCRQIASVFPINFVGSKTPAPQSLVLVSYNTKMNGLTQKHSDTDPNGAIEYLLNSNADILCIQEYYVLPDEEHLTQRDVDSLFKSYPYKHIKFDTDYYDGLTGLATFSKYPIVKCGRIEYESAFNASIYTDIVVNGDTIRVINNHLESNRFSGNDLLLAKQLRNDFSSEAVLNTTAYFSQKLQIAYRVRAAQADKVQEVIKSTRHKLLVCGDFNDVPASYAYNTIKGRLNDAFIKHGTGFGRTFDAPFYILRLDHVFYDDNFEVQDFEIGKVMASDHFPVKCRLRIK